MQPPFYASSGGALHESLTALAVFTGLYTVRLIIEVKLMLKAIRKGPDPDHEPEAPLVPEKLVAAE
ncbi:MAG TPA: hypothetical protein DEQ45_18970 [Agrobacterium sp.]|nr:hypothetical protein [Agrobacterium sp.]